MDVEGKLLAAMVECGLSKDRAQIRSAEFAPIVRRDLNTVERDEEIVSDYAHLSASQVAEKRNISRRTVFRAVQRCHKRADRDTDSERSCKKKRGGE